MQTSVAGLNLFDMVMGLGGGLALFLYGMRKMTEALKTVAGGRLKDLLGKLTTNRFTGALSGALITAVIQSSSVTTVMVVGFISAGLMTFTQSVGVIMGANIGTTVTAQIIAFKVTEFSLVMIAAGFLVELLAKDKRVRQSGIAVMGLGLLFFGMQLMSDAAAPLRSHAPFIAAMTELRNPLLGMLAGLVFTAVVQSSSATTGIVIVLASQGLITLEAGIAMVFGANVGTCVTAALSAIGKPRDAVKAVAVHIAFNLLGVVLWIGFIPIFADLVRAVSPGSPELTGAAKLAADVPRQIANAHTLFNVANTVLFLGFARTISRWIDRAVPKPKALPPGEGEPQYLEELYLEQPSVALDQVKRELGRLAAFTQRMAARALPAALAGGDSELNALRQGDEDVDKLHGAIVTYLGQLSLRDLVEPQPERIQEYLSIANYLESVGDVVESGFVPGGYKRLEAGVAIHAASRSHLESLANQAVTQLDRVVAAFMKGDVEAAAAVLQSKQDFNAAADAIRAGLTKQLGKDPKAGLAEYRIAMEHVDSIKRLHTLARRIARMFLDFHAGRDVAGEGD